MLCGSSQHCQLSYTFLWNRNAFSLSFPPFFFFTTIVFLLFGGSDSSLLSPLGSSLHSAGLCFLHGEGFLLNPSPSLGIMDHLPYRAEIHTHPFSKEALRMFKMWKQFREEKNGEKWRTLVSVPHWGELQILLSRWKGIILSSFHSSNSRRLTYHFSGKGLIDS